MPTTCESTCSMGEAVRINGSKMKSDITPPRKSPIGIVMNGYEIVLVQRLLQHSFAAVTQRYIGIEPQRIKQAIQNHAQLI